VALWFSAWLDTALHLEIDFVIGTVKVVLKYPLLNSYPQASTAKTGIVKAVEER